VNGLRALRLEPTAGAPNVIGGSAANSVAAGVFGATIGGGEQNTIQPGATRAVIAGGSGNAVQSNAFNSAIGGGAVNAVGGAFATVPGGQANAALGSYSMAAGYRAKANFQGSFVWADSTDTDFGDTAGNQFLIRASGGVGIGTTHPLRPLHIAAIERPEIILEGLDGLADFRKWNFFVAGPAAGTRKSLYLRLLNDAGDATTIQSMVWDGNGNVGIGTTSPGGKLTVVGAGGDYRSVTIDSAEIKFRGETLAHFSLTANRIPGAFTIEDTSDSQFPGSPPRRTMMTIGADGNVGIGTSSPQARLDVNGDLAVDGGHELQLLSTDNSVASRIMNPTTGLREISFVTGAPLTEAMRITQAGNVGVGTATPNTQFSGTEMPAASSVSWMALHAFGSCNV